MFGALTTFNFDRRDNNLKGEVQEGYTYRERKSELEARYSKTATAISKFQILIITEKL